MDETGKEKTDTIDVAYVAHLARLHLTDAERKEFQGQLDRILDHVRDIRQIDVSGVEPTAHAIAVQNVFRADQVRESLPAERVLANAPVHVDGQFAVPKIVE